MKLDSHELAKILLENDAAPVACSVDVSTGEEDSEVRVFGDLVEISELPSNIGFGCNQVTLLFEGSLNIDK